MQAIALRALLKVSMKPSPCAFTSTPRWRATIRRTMVLCVSSTFIHAESPSSTARVVDPSMSEKTTVTVPTSVSIGGRNGSFITESATMSIDVARKLWIAESAPEVAAGVCFGDVTVGRTLRHQAERAGTELDDFSDS